MLCLLVPSTGEDGDHCTHPASVRSVGGTSSAVVAVLPTWFGMGACDGGVCVGDRLYDVAALSMLVAVLLGCWVTCGS